MYQTSSELIAELAKKWNIPLDRDHVIGHHEINSRKTCPGKKVDLDKLVRMALVIIFPDQLTQPGSGLSPTPTPPSVQKAVQQNVRPTAAQRNTKSERI